MKLKRGLSRFWSFIYRAKLMRAPMPFWRVVVEAKPDRGVRRWPKNCDAVVTAVYVWARTIEEAEGLASLALEQEGLEAVTADAIKRSPAAAPRRTPAAVARGELGVLTRARETSGERPQHRTSRP